MPPPRAPLLRVPYTDPFPAPRLIPASATTPEAAIEALVRFLQPSLPRYRTNRNQEVRSTLILTGAGISVASGLADYRGTNGTYTLNRKYRPVYFHEFCASHEARKRYWARSFLGWENLAKAKPNVAHEAVGRLGPSSSSPSTREGEEERRKGGLGISKHLITQNVDSFHPTSHPHLPTTELHGYLRTLTCLTCGTEYARSSFQRDLRRLNPSWAIFLDEMLASGALAVEDPKQREKLGLKTNPDGDVDVPGARYDTFRYPACPTCSSSASAACHTDQDGAYTPPPSSASTSTPSEDNVKQKGILKPSVTMFGESIPSPRKIEAERAVDAAGRILVIGSSLATYSAWRLVKRAHDRGMPVGILNVGGVRGEEGFFDTDTAEDGAGSDAVRVSVRADEVLPKVVEELGRLG